MVKNISSQQLVEMWKTEPDNLEIIDVREQDEYDLIRIKDSKLIPLSQIGEKMDEIDWNKKVVFVCRTGSRSGYVAHILSQGGHQSINLDGGIYELNLDNCDCIEKAPSCCGGYF